MLMTVALLSVISCAVAEEKIYIDSKEMCMEFDSFRIHTGNNEWIEAHTTHRDKTGLYIYEKYINKSKNGPNAEYEKTWKCPYCYNYYPEGKPCTNQKCPSKNK